MFTGRQALELPSLQRSGRSHLGSEANKGFPSQQMVRLILDERVGFPSPWNQSSLEVNALRLISIRRTHCVASESSRRTVVPSE